MTDRIRPLGHPAGRPRTATPRPDSEITPPAPAARAASRTQVDVDPLARWRARLDDAEALEDGLHVSLDRRPDADLSACLQEMASHRQAALGTLLAALRTPDRAWEDRIEQHSLNWGHAVLSILSRGGTFSCQLIASRAHHHTSHWSPAPACGYCRAPREYEHLTSPLGLTDRRTLRCPRCGPALSLPATLLLLDVGVPNALFPGQPADVHVTVPDRARGLLAVHLRPHSTRRGSYDHAVLAATPGRHTVTLTVPEEPLPELDRLWALYVDRFHLAYHQNRVPLLPQQ
ncbi:hypothetical protein [Streptomyces sp. NPDC050535]|uniref:hypothetical protein n=1 Tax=Streptomyces sp. NPDC050535 TaxID=3365626 RepID=UPI0037A76F05